MPKPWILTPYSSRINGRLDRICLNAEIDRNDSLRLTLRLPLKTLSYSWPASCSPVSVKPRDIYFPGLSGSRASTRCTCGHLNRATGKRSRESQKKKEKQQLENLAASLMHPPPGSRSIQRQVWWRSPLQATPVASQNNRTSHAATPPHPVTPFSRLLNMTPHMGNETICRRSWRR
jgi:hypothetical protein